jgi:RHS repeat-associated protein
MFSNTSNPRPKSNPFGSSINTRSFSAGSGFRFGFNGKENFDQYQDYGMRIYYPNLGKFWSVDPKLAILASWTTYAFCKNNPIIMFEPDGQFPFPIHIRSFAPYKQFGGWFAGDNRGFSTALSATSRLAQSFVINTDNHTYSGLTTGSSPSYHPILGKATANDDRGSISNLKSSNNRNGSITTSFTSTMAGRNPLIKGSPDIDVKTSFVLTENKAAGTLNVSVSQTGDAFPAAETIISDTKGNMLMIGVSPAIGNPYTSLPGKGNKSMMAVNFTVTMDKKGVFTGVVTGSGKNAKKYSVGDWNNRLKSTPAVKQSEPRQTSGYMSSPTTGIPVPF